MVTNRQVTGAIKSDFFISISTGDGLLLGTVIVGGNDRWVCIDVVVCAREDTFCCDLTFGGSRLLSLDKWFTQWESC